MTVPERSSYVGLDPNRPHIALVGFMGAGKSAVGRALATRLKCRFVDLDEVISESAGKSIPEIFREDGEMAFRAKERATLRDALADGGPTIIATGGGTYLDNRNRKELGTRARTVYLETDIATLIGRITTHDDVEQRPLLTGPDPVATITRLLADRKPVYELSELSIRTTARSVEEVVIEILRALKIERSGRGDVRASTMGQTRVPKETSPMRRATPKAATDKAIIPVESAMGPYDVRLRSDSGSWIAEGIAQLCPGPRITVISDTNVVPLHGQRLLDNLRTLGKETQLLQFDPGEESKTLGTASRLYDHLLTSGMTRSDAIVGLGGGVVGDVAGFVASTFLRGVGYIQVPTTTLAAVDSSVGGKTAVNTPRGKNLVGTFYPARGVFIAIEHLATQTRHAHAAGLVEALKKAATMDAGLFEHIKESNNELLDFHPDTLIPIIARSVELKGQVVSEDEREHGIRAVLNYGHTVGHAIETGENYQLFHGEAVALGMIAEAQWAEMEGFSKQVSPQLREALELLGMRTDWRKTRIDLEALGVDKKRTGSGLRVPIVPKIGEYDLKTVPVANLTEFVKRRSTE